MAFNNKKLDNIADYKARLALRSIFGTDKISDEIGTELPTNIVKLFEAMKQLYKNGYMNCVNQVIKSISMEDEL